MRWTSLSNRRGPGLLVLGNVLFTQKKKKLPKSPFIPVSSAFSLSLDRHVVFTKDLLHWLHVVFVESVATLNYEFINDRKTRMLQKQPVSSFRCYH